MFFTSYIRICLAALLLPAAGADLASDPVFSLTFDSDLKSVSGLTPTNTNTPELVPGIHGQAARFREGTVLRYLSASAFPKQSGTLSLWVNPARDGIGPNDGSRHTFFREDGPYKAARTNALWAWLHSGIGYRFDLRDPNDNYLYFEPLPAWKKGQWHHLALEWNQQRGSRIFIDGALAVVSKPTTYTPIHYPAFFLGASTSEGLHAWEGSLDEIKLYDRELSPQEILTEYKRFNLPAPPPTDPWTPIPPPANQPPTFQLKAAPLHGIEKITYRQWPDSLRISNGTVDLVIAPKAGRILYYGFCNQGNVLWENPKPGQRQWTNPGGDKAWPWPDTLWNPPLKTEFVPPRQWDGESHQAAITSTLSVRTTSNLWQGMRVVRDISLSPTGTQVRIRTRVTTDDNTPAIATPWSITQVSPGNAILFTYPPPDTNLDATFIGSTLTCARYPLPGICLYPSPSINVKIFGNGMHLGWWNRRTLFTQHLIPTAAQKKAWKPYEPLQIYWDNAGTNGPTPYIELEFAAPQRLVNDSTLEVIWELFSLPNSAQSDPRSAVETFARSCGIPSH